MGISIDEIVEKAIPINDRECIVSKMPGCKRDCPTTVSYKMAKREGLKKRIQELLAEQREQLLIEFNLSNDDLNETWVSDKG